MSDLTYAVGDVHGRLDLLERAFDRMAADADGCPHRVIMLGDYVDRGPESAGVIDFLIRRQVRADVTCLKGNHEAMMSGALAGDDVALRSWLSNGGVETLRSYGARNASEMGQAIPAAHVAWLSALPLAATDAHRIFVHAGLEPDVPLSRQDEATLLWIRTPFLRAPAGAFEAHVVHGHTPVWDAKPDPAVPELLAHRTNLDTGACFTGVLTVGVFDAAAPGGPIAVLAVST